MFIPCRMHQQNMARPYNRILFNHKKNEVLNQSYTTRMTTGNIVPNERSQSQKTTQPMIPFT